MEADFEVGQKVMCRNAGKPWRAGIITNTHPLKVQPDGWDEDYRWDEVAQESKFRVGQRVKCRNLGKPWKHGVVTSATPLKVQPDGWDEDFRWDDVSEAVEHESE